LQTINPRSGLQNGLKLEGSRPVADPARGHPAASTNSACCGLLQHAGIALHSQHRRPRALRRGLPRQSPGRRRVSLPPAGGPIEIQPVPQGQVTAAQARGTPRAAQAASINKVAGAARADRPGARGPIPAGWKPISAGGPVFLHGARPTAGPPAADDAGCAEPSRLSNRLAGWNAEAVQVARQRSGMGRSIEGNASPQRSRCRSTQRNF